MPILKFTISLPFQSSPSLGAGSNYFFAFFIRFFPPFQSSPSLGAGSNGADPYPVAIHYKFQSSPSLGAGSNFEGAAVMWTITAVSILSQLRCWEQQQPFVRLVVVEMFQSSPSLGAGSNNFA